MRQRQRFLTTFLVFLGISIILVVFFKTAVGQVISGIAEVIVVPVQKTFYQGFVRLTGVNESQELAALKNENAKLLQRLVKEAEVEKENKALHDQFATANIPPKQLLPAAVISSHTADVGIIEPTEIVIDKGKRQGVRIGDAVIYKEMVVGQVVQVSDNRSAVRIPTSKQSSIPATTVKTNALGIVKGQDDSIIVDNVLLSDTLEVKDLLITKGNVDGQGKGYPPGLIIGKITAVHKKASALFQTAEVAPILSLNRLTTVFVYQN